MNRMKTMIYTGCIAVLALFGACQKDKGMEADPAQVSVELASPLRGAMYRNGDTVWLRGRVSYPGQMHGYELKLSDSATGMILHDVAKHVHGDNFTLDGYWIGAVSAATTVNLSLAVSIDHGGGIARHELSFFLLP